MDSDIVLFLGIGAIFLVLVTGGTMMLDSASCKSRWATSGMRVDWGPLQGCLVQRKDGTWVPDKMLREFTQ